MKKYFALIFLILITIFLGREYWVENSRDFQLFAEKDYLLIRSETGKIWGYGNLENPSAENLRQNISSYFSREKIQDIRQLDENKEYRDGKMVWQKISRDFVNLDFQGKKLLFVLDEPDEKSREKLINSPLSLKADWLVLNNNFVLDFLPEQKRGILFISEKNPSKKIREKSREKNIPLISTQNTGGFSLKIEEENWQLQTRN